MRHSEITLVCEKGFYIDPSLVKPIGIHNKSYCWGVFAENNTGNTPQDLIISPFPYSSWAGIVRLQIRINSANSETSQINVLKILDKNEANVLAMQTMHAGYTHDLMDIIIEIPDARRVSSTPKPKEEEGCDVASRLREIYDKYVHNKMMVIQQDLEESSLKICFFNESRDVVRSVFDPISEASDFDKYCINKIRWEWLHILALHAFHGLERFRFKYNKTDNDGLISLDMHDSCATIGEIFKYFGKKNTSPFLAVTGFNLSQHHLRLRAISSEVDAVYTFKTECRIKIREDSKQQVSTLGSRGLSHIAMAALREIENFKILSSSVEGLQRQDSKNENCSLYINAVSSILSEENRSNIERSIKQAFKEKIKEDEQAADPGIPNACSQCSDVRLEAYKRQPYKLFLSFRQEMMTDEVRVFLTSFLREHGFELI